MYTTLLKVPHVLQEHAVLPLLKWLMSVSTLMLEASLVYFHVLELQVRCPPAGPQFCIV